MSSGEAGRQGVACVGNFVLDIVHDIPTWPQKSDLVSISSQTSGLGGGPANVSADLTAMGVRYPIVPVGLVGADGLGDEVLSLCRKAGLDTARIGRTDESATSQTHVMNVPGDSRTFFHHPGVNDLLDPRHIDVPGLAGQGLRIFYLGYLNLLPCLDRFGANDRPVVCDVLNEARSYGMMTCVDLVSSQSETFRETVFAALPEIDVLFLNEVEASRATGIAIDSADDTEAMIRAARVLAAGGVRRAVVMHSSKCCIWHEDGEANLHIPDPLPPNEIVSAVGAGDAFAAGVIHGLHEGWSRGMCLKLACAAAAACLKGQTATEGIDSGVLMEFQPSAV